MSGNFYSISSIGSGRSETYCEILPGSEADLYIAGDLNLHPEVLTSTVFDSIHIETNSGVKKEIRFAHRSVTGYAENLFENMTFWNFMIRDLDISSSAKKTCESYDYIFTVSTDKFR